MKKTINKIGILLCVGFCIIFLKNSNLFAITSKFEFIISTVGIPRYNSKKQEINEEIYNTYNIFCYGSPIQLLNLKEQRWKNTKYGKWCKESGAYKGKGTRGEYYLLGTNYTGNPIHNYYFPLDEVPTKSPEQWNFVYMASALNSWKDKNNYKYVEQLEFMKNTNLMFNDLKNKDTAMNPDKIKTYNISALKIGLNKARLDTAATWKTNGIVYVKRLLSRENMDSDIFNTTYGSRCRVKNRYKYRTKHITR